VVRAHELTALCHAAMTKPAGTPWGSSIPAGAGADLLLVGGAYPYANGFVSPSNDEADGSFMGGPRCQLVGGVACLWLVVRARELTALCHAAMTKPAGTPWGVLDASWCGGWLAFGWWCVPVC